MTKTNLIPAEIIENKVYNIRNQKVMLDSDLAALYDVETKVFNQAVKRNLERFPEDFMFQLSDEEWTTLRSQIVTSKGNKGGRRYNPYVFTEQGISMLSSVLNSKRAIAVNIQIMRTFVKIREIALTHKDIAEKISDLEQRFGEYVGETNISLIEHEEKINEIFSCIQYLIEKHKPSKIGFKAE